MSWPIVAIDQNAIRVKSCSYSRWRLLASENADWQEDEELKDALGCYVKENLRRIEVLDFVTRDFSQCAWSLRTLDRRLEYFGIKYTDRTVQVDEVEEAVKKELEGPGQLLG